ncbi:MAG: long-chain fatty acid--CoA ligase [Pseudomonadota bacterium]
MTEKLWHGKNWPEGVPHDVTGYEAPLQSILDEAAAAFPQATYTIFEGARRTYAQVRDAANRVANFLASRGVRKGDRVAIFLPNIPHYPEVFFGILKAGATAVTCNPMYTAPELNFQLRDAGAKAVFVMDHPQFYPLAKEAIAGTDVGTLVVCGVGPYLPKLKGFIGGLLGKIPTAGTLEPGHLRFKDVLAASAPTPPIFEVEPLDDVAIILYTGGTTGVPKGAALTHANLLSNVRNALQWIRISQTPGAPRDTLKRGGFHTFLGVLPWYHSFGMTLCLLCSAASASQLVCIPDPRAGDPPFTKVLEAVQRYRCTMVIGVPTIYSAFVNHPNLDSFDLTSIQACGSGGAPLPLEVIRQFEAKTGAVIFEGYGLTETSPMLTVNPTNTVQRRIGAVGLPLPGTDVKIVDLDTGLVEMAQGEDGEIAASGAQIMKGYWGREDADGEVFRTIGGRRYFLTGDIGHVDEDGFVVITDRKKDLILVGGFNAYPKEIEEVLFTHPKVAGAAVIGKPDPNSGERVKAFIQLKVGETATVEEILEFCKTRMAGYKRPREVEFRSELPTSAVGKVLRRVLKDEEKAKGA